MTDEPDSLRAGLVREGRRRAIAEYVGRYGSATVTELAALLSASPGTVRADLRALDSQEVLVRTRGGAVTRPEFSWRERPSTERLGIAAAEKAAIARHCVVHYLDAGDAVFLDAGTTTLAIAHEIVSRQIRVTVITNSLDSASILATAPDVSLFVTGGEYRTTGASLVGDWVLRALASVRVRTVFLGANAISATAGVTIPDLAEAATKRALIESAERVIVVADHSKLNRTSLGFVAPLSDIEAIVTDDAGDPAVMRPFEAVNVRIELASVKQAEGPGEGERTARSNDSAQVAGG